MTGDIDLGGSEYGPRSLRVLRPDGRYIDCLGSDAVDDPRSERFYVTPSAQTLREIAAMVDRGPLNVTVDQVLPLEEVAQAHQLSESGGVRGKIVLTPWNAPD
ncbi:zinc-binding dehydrogenase [Nocardia brasiliensis]|uniref:zinc-binding dehydrogenase n=1 Tax=Nocardia brasiliensis TaxID=37326 RepID=UPI00245414C3|nr:zinc-binding dehydrogenase [Nocardia brasiliensis]